MFIRIILNNIINIFYILVIIQTLNGTQKNWKVNIKNDLIKDVFEKKYQLTRPLMPKLYLLIFVWFIY